MSNTSTTTIIEDKANVARAIFFPQMINDRGLLSRAAFSLRHNESYISVCRMDIDSWLDDMKAIPANTERQLYGYAVLNVGDVRKQSFSHDNHKVELDVVDKHTGKNKSHAGIVVAFDGEGLQGDKNSILKVLPPNTYAQTLLLKVQRRLLKLANKHYIKWQEPQDDKDSAVKPEPSDNNSNL